MSDTHSLRVLVDGLEAELDAADDQPASGMSGLGNRELQDIATRAWRVIQRVQGMVLVPTVAEADERRLFRTREFESASSSRDLVTSWLRCDPSVAGKLLRVGKATIPGPYTATGDALASGEIDVDHAAKVVTAVRRLPDAVVDLDQRHEAENTMLDVAKAADPQVTNAAGYRLLELVAPDEAADYLDAKAERERRRAEEARWLEITSTPVAGCKELRLRLEASTMNTLARLVESLTQHAATDPGTAPTGTGASTGVDADSDSGDAGSDSNVLAGPRGDEQPDGALPAGTGGPGVAGAPLACVIPIERRRADAMAELITSMAQPHPADELDPVQLRRLADELSATPVGRRGLGAAKGARGAQRARDAQVVETTEATGRAGATEAAGEEIDQGLEQGLERGLGQVGGQPRSQAQNWRRSQGQGQGRDRNRGRGERPSLIVITAYDQARQKFRAGEASSPGSATTRLSPVEVDTMACEGPVTPVWMTRNQTPVTVASPSRYFRGKQLAALIARDRGCSFPGCNRGLRYSHAHHIIPVSQGGETKVDNGVLLCGTHHTVIHTPGGWTIQLGEDRLPEFIPPYWIDPTRAPQRHTRYQLQLPLAA